MLDLRSSGIAILIFLGYEGLELAAYSGDSEVWTNLELLQEINPRTDPLRICRHPLSHGHLIPISQISMACPDAASCAFGDGLLVFALP